MLDKNSMKSILKWGAVLVAAIIAGVGEFADQKEEERIDELEKRVAKLETNEEDA